AQNLRREIGQPSQEGWAEIEAHPGVVVAQLNDLAFGVDQAGARIRSIAFARDALVPVVERRRRILDLDRFQPRVLPWRLVEMSVDTQVARDGFAHDSTSGSMPKVRDGDSAPCSGSRW